MEEFCDKCGSDPCICNRENPDGYECKNCGYIPTTRELQRGLCPKCHVKQREQHDQNT